MAGELLPSALFMRNALAVLVIGVVIGIVLTLVFHRLGRIEHAVANQNSRLTILEGERGQRLQMKARAKKVFSVLVGVSRKLLRLP